MDCLRKYVFSGGMITILNSTQRDTRHVDINIHMQLEGVSNLISMHGYASGTRAEVGEITGNGSGQVVYGEGLGTLAVNLCIQALREMDLDPGMEVRGELKIPKPTDLQRQLAFWKRFGFKVEARRALSPEINAELGELCTVPGAVLGGALAGLLPLKDFQVVSRKPSGKT